MQPIPIEKFAIKPMHLWDNQWLLLTAGDYSASDFNAMTVGWGSIGYIWRRPFVQVFVRPVRYTYQFIQKHDTFTLCAFPQKYHAKLEMLGRRSGRDGDKIGESGLTPMPTKFIAAPGYKEAELIIECRKIYWDDIRPENFLDSRIDLHYPEKDYHRIYFGEILYIEADDRYHSNF